MESEPVPEQELSVASFFTGRTLLITGATGFMGKVLLEKLLRACPGIVRIYVLLRPKEGHTLSQRLDLLTKSQVFNRLKQECPQALSKVVPVKGDVSKDDLQLSEEDEKVLLEEVSVVFHSAATVKFDQPLKGSLQINVLAVIRVVELCRRMKNVAALVHVSTAYCNCERKEIHETVYPMAYHPTHILNIADNLDEATLNNISPTLIRPKPNTYIYTKAMAEVLLQKEAEEAKLPVAIVRPSIVVGAWKEPFPGWIDTTNGPAGLSIGYSKGIVKSFIADVGLIADFVPVDMATNLMIAAAWDVATHRRDKVQVYNYTSGSLNPLLWGDYQYLGKVTMLKNPTETTLWYPCGNFKTNRVVHGTIDFLFHCVPAHLMDLYARVSGGKPRMVRIYGKLSRACKALQYFTTREWQHSNDNVLALWGRLSKPDQDTFFFDLRQMNWTTYMRQYVLGIKRFLLKEDLVVGLPQALSRMRRLHILHRLAQMFGMYLVWRLLTFMLMDPIHACIVVVLGLAATCCL